jgi:hypothetical protein
MLARALAERGGDVELQGTVVHRARALTLSACAAVAAVVAMLGQLTPLVGAALMLTIMLSLVRDLEGGSGWLRRLVVLRDIGHNVITWRTPRLPTHAASKPEDHRPPWLAEDAITGGPVLLICAPADGAPGEDRRHHRMHLAVLCAVLLAAIGVGVSGLLASIGAGLLALLSAVLIVQHIQSPPRLQASSAVPVCLELLDDLNTEPLTNLSLAMAFLEGGSHHDGLEILLRNYAAVLPPERTRVLLLTPDDMPLSIQRSEGFLQRRPADTLILRAAEGLPITRGVSGSARILRLGWRSATLRGELTQIAAIRKIIVRLDQAAGSDQW